MEQMGQRLPGSVVKCCHMLSNVFKWCQLLPVVVNVYCTSPGSPIYKNPRIAWMLWVSLPHVGLVSSLFFCSVLRRGDSSMESLIAAARHWQFAHAVTKNLSQGWTVDTLDKVNGPRELQGTLLLLYLSNHLTVSDRCFISLFQKIHFGYCNECTWVSFLCFFFLNHVVSSARVEASFLSCNLCPFLGEGTTR